MPVKALPFVLGAVGGGLVAWAAWAFFQKKLEASFAAGQATLNASLQAGQVELTRRFTGDTQEAARTVLTLVGALVPAQVDAGIIQTLNAYGITPTTGQKIARIVNALPG